jgi:ATP-dependent DNA helicase RecQ
LKAKDVLKKYWGYSDFRPNQMPIIESIINGFDTLALLPTGGGKSICYQVPSLVREGMCLVVSPLIALMQDQVEGLKKNGLRAQAITSDMSRKEIDIALDNAQFEQLDFFYVSPERLKTDLFKVRFRNMKISLIAVDEAHCISEWGHDFRPPYRDIWELREIHPNVPIIALTATATERVRKDISEDLKLKSPNYFEGSFLRENLSYEFYEVQNKLQHIIKTCEIFRGKSGVVYCQTRKDTKDVTKALIASGFSAATYHGGLDGEIRKNKLSAWLKNDIRIMVATNAFGMGIDKPDVRFVLHYELPTNIEAYYQEAGRSGRDGASSRNIGFYEHGDLDKMKKKELDRFPPIDSIKTVYRALCNHLRIAIGSGARESYPLELKTFLTKYSLDPTLTYNSLKILEMNGTLIFNESVFHKTKLKFSVSNTGLYSFQIKNPTYDPLITLLSRSYPGIFSSFWEIDDYKLVQRLKISKSELIKQLQYLEKQGLLDINWQSDLPQVYFQHERLPDDYLTISPDVYQRRKEIALQKLDAMIQLIQRPLCRSVQIMHYFGQESEKCGKCDVCLGESTSSYTTEELIDAIQEVLKKKSLTLDELLTELHLQKNQRIIQALNFLVDEGIIVANGNTFTSVSS